VGLSNIDETEISDIFVFLVELFNAPGVATERSSCVGAKDKHYGPWANDSREVYRRTIS
jgi:hypothetical protein